MITTSISVLGNFLSSLLNFIILLATGVVLCVGVTFSIKGLNFLDSVPQWISSKIFKKPMDAEKDEASIFEKTGRSLLLLLGLYFLFLTGVFFTILGVVFLILYLFFKFSKGTLSEKTKKLGGLFKNTFGVVKHSCAKCGYLLNRSKGKITESYEEFNEKYLNRQPKEYRRFQDRFNIFNRAQQVSEPPEDDIIDDTEVIVPPTGTFEEMELEQEEPVSEVVNNFEMPKKVNRKNKLSKSKVDMFVSQQEQPTEEPEVTKIQEPEVNLSEQELTEVQKPQGSQKYQWDDDTLVFNPKKISVLSFSKDNDRLKGFEQKVDEAVKVFDETVETCINCRKQLKILAEDTVQSNDFKITEVRKMHRNIVTLINGFDEKELVTGFEEVSNYINDASKRDIDISDMVGDEPQQYLDMLNEKICYVRDKSTHSKIIKTLELLESYLKDIQSTQEVTNNTISVDDCNNMVDSFIKNVKSFNKVKVLEKVQELTDDELVCYIDKLRYYFNTMEQSRTDIEMALNNIRVTDNTNFLLIKNKYDTVMFDYRNNSTMIKEILKEE